MSLVKRAFPGRLIIGNNIENSALSGHFVWLIEFNRRGGCYGRCQIYEEEEEEEEDKEAKQLPLLVANGTLKREEKKRKAQSFRAHFIGLYRRGNWMPLDAAKIRPPHCECVTAELFNADERRREWGKEGPTDGSIYPSGGAVREFICSSCKITAIGGRSRRRREWRRKGSQ